MGQLQVSQYNTMPKLLAIPDIHGEIGALTRVIHLAEENGFSLENGDELVQLGDKNDRGQNSYEVFEYFKALKDKYPKQVHCLWGNHELLFWNAARWRDVDLFLDNGGRATVRSYGKHTGCYGPRGLGNALAKSGHSDFIRNQYSFFETEEYFFCHSPIPVEKYRGGVGTLEKWCQDLELLIWSPWLHHHYDFEDRKQRQSQNWVDPKPFGMDKLFIHGHIHDLTYDGQQYLAPKVRRYGNSILLDTGCGCTPEAPLSCLELSTMTVYNSDGDIYAI